MALSNQAVKNLMSAVTSQEFGNLIADGVNAGLLASHVLAGAIVATNASQTVDFGSLAVGDIVVQIPLTTPGSTAYHVVATAGTLPVAAVVTSLYLVIRAKADASAVKF